MQWLQKMHDAIWNPFLNRFFYYWHYVDSMLFVFLVTTITWFLIDRKIGVKLLFIMGLSTFLNVLLKNTFGLPRPCQLDPALGLICLKSFGLPSGASQSAVLLGGILILEWRRKLAWVFAIPFAAFLCFSRLYLGVHFFSDVLGGIIVGSILLIVYWKFFPKAEKYWKPLLMLWLFFIFLTRPDLFWFFSAVALGLTLYERGKPWKPLPINIRLVQTVVMAIGVVFLTAKLKPVSALTFPLTFFLGLWISTLGNWLFQRWK